MRLLLKSRNFHDILTGLSVEHFIRGAYYLALEKLFYQAKYKINWAAKPINKGENKMKKLHLLIAIVSLAFSGAAHAQFTGTAAIGGAGTYDSTTLTLGATNAFESGDGTFSGISFGAGSISNSTISLNGFDKVTLTAAQPTFEISSSTTPVDEYAFEITSITPDSTIAGKYTGTGSFIDNEDVLPTTSGTFTLSYSGASDVSDGYSFTATAAPEPSAWALTLICGASLVYLLRRALRD
jgi:hypothetical protein